MVCDIKSAPSFSPEFFNKSQYDNFENALNFYREKGHIFGTTDEIKEFNSIMEFVYLGRKHIKCNTIEDIDKYIIMA